MHDPLVVIFELKTPCPPRKGWGPPKKKRWTVGRWRYLDDGGDPKMSNKPIYPWYRPAAWHPVAFGHEWKWRPIVTVWHKEPKGHDSGTICKGMKGTNLSLHNVTWAIKHWRHLEFQWPFPQRIRFWLTKRCTECGHRFHWKQPRYGYMSTDKVWHNECMSLNQARGQLDDAYSVMKFTADDTQKWRVEQRLKNLDEKEKSLVECDPE